MSLGVKAIGAQAIPMASAKGSPVAFAGGQSADSVSFSGAPGKARAQLPFVGAIGSFVGNIFGMIGGLFHSVVGLVTAPFHWIGGALSGGIGCIRGILPF